MTTGERVRDALFLGPLPDGFSRRVYRLASGLELAMEPGRVPDAVVVVMRGELELECKTGAHRRFGRGAMIPITRLPVTHLRSVGPGPLILVAVSRTSVPPTDEFLGGSGS
jgi:hypothetical protein